MNFSTENINVGDKVICCSINNDDRIGVVVKKTPSGLIDVNFGRYQYRFDKFGRKRGGSSWSREWLKYCTAEDEEKIITEQKRKTLIRIIKESELQDFSMESLEQIYSICKKELERK